MRAGSRWNAPATRIIDNVLNQYDLVYTAFDEHWSDHRAFQVDLDHKFEFYQGQQIVPCNTYLPKNPEDFDAWSQHLDHQWKAQLQVWDEFYSSLDTDVPENVLLHSARSFAKLMRTTIGNPTVLKTLEFGFARNPWFLSKLICDGHATNEGQLKFRQDHGQNLSQTDPLWLKIRRSPFWRPGVTFEELEQRLAHQENSVKQDRLRALCTRMRGSVTDLFGWLRVTEAPANHHIFNGALGPQAHAATTAREALEKS